MVSLKKERFIGFFHSGYESLRESKPWSEGRVAVTQLLECRT